MEDPDSILNSMFNSKDVLQKLKKFMGNEPDIPIGKNLFTVEKVSKDETITINVVVNAKAQVKLKKLTAEEIERFTTKLRQTKITSFFQNTRLENSTVFPDQYAQEVDYQNLSVPSTIPESSDYQVPKKLPRIESRGNFARKRTNPIYAHVQDSDAKLQRFFKENVEQEPIRLDKIKAPRKRSEDSDYGSLSCKSIKVEEDSNTYCGVIQSTELQNRIFKNELGQKISTPLNPETPNGRKVDEIIAYCVKDNDILFEVTWKNSEDISWVSLENLKDSRKLENYMEFLYITKHTCMNNYFNKVSNLTPEQIQEAFQGQSKNILKELETFDINEYKRSILLGMLLDDGTREPNNALRKLCFLKYFYDRKNYRDMVNDTILGKIRLMNPGVGIEFENKVDFEPLVEDFTYISKNIVSPGVHIINASSIRCCSCKDKCKNELKCCSTRKTGRLAYNSRKCLTNFGNTNLPIYECNKNCKCGPDCINRVVQLGSNITLCLFKTSTGKDLGLKTRDLIHKGQFISEYVGEIIDYDTAEKRGRRYMRNGTHYVFNMDFYPSAEPYSIDATKFGNATRFINHSCNPNCAVYSVWYDCVDKNFPKLAFFALRNIDKNEELTIDYSGSGESNNLKFLDNCICGADNCRQTVYT